MAAGSNAVGILVQAHCSVSRLVAEMVVVV